VNSLYAGNGAKRTHSKNGRLGRAGLDMPASLKRFTLTIAPGSMVTIHLLRVWRGCAMATKTGMCACCGFGGMRYVRAATTARAWRLLVAGALCPRGDGRVLVAGAPWARTHWRLVVPSCRSP
jgi:hypothetical protein